MSWFSPEGAEWSYVSRKLIPARLIVLWGVMVVPIAITTIVAALVGGAAWVAPSAILVFTAFLTWVIYRQVTAHAWAEREDDLVVKRGRLFRSVSVIPYGRMQYVEVSAGPLARAFGIATVQLHTASPGTDARISGVPTDEAARLRDRLTTLGGAKLAGL